VDILHKFESVGQNSPLENLYSFDELCIAANKRMEGWTLSRTDLSLIVKHLHNERKLVCRLFKDGSVQAGFSFLPRKSHVTKCIIQLQAVRFLTKGASEMRISDAEAGMLIVRTTIKSLKQQIIQLETRLER
jgi:hypothetical protein